MRVYKMPKLFSYGRFKRSTEPSACCPQGIISSVGWEPFRHLRQVSWHLQHCMTYLWSISGVQGKIQLMGRSQPFLWFHVFWNHHNRDGTMLRTWTLEEWLDLECSYSYNCLNWGYLFIIWDCLCYVVSFVHYSQMSYFFLVRLFGE